MMSHRQKKGLVDYFFGSPGDRPRLLRQSVVLIASLSIVFLCLFLYLSLSRVALDVMVLPHTAFPPRALIGGKVLNSYILSLENKARNEKELILMARRPKGFITITPERVHLGAGEHKKVPVYVTVDQVPPGAGSEAIEIVLESGGRDRLTIRKGVRFLVPDTR
jgi:hypothetical protein